MHSFPVQHPLLDTLGWTLLHSLWQGLAIALLLGLALRLMRRRSAAERYLASLSALGLALLAAAATFWLQLPAAPQPVNETFAALTPAAPAADLVLAAEKPLPSWEAWLPLLSLAWLLGFAAFAIRWAAGFAWLQKVRFRHVQVPGYEWQDRLNRLAQRMGIQQTLLLLESPYIQSPMVIGHWRPVLLFPLSMLSGLAPAQLEAILAHELAHIRRYDFLVNLLQTWVEAVFFYHPAIWWISARVRDEREHACDDTAVRISGNALLYARVLADLEEQRLHSTQLAPGLGGRRSQLLARIRRIVLPGSETEAPQARPVYVAALLLTLLTLNWLTPKPLEAQSLLEDSLGRLEGILPYFASAQAAETESGPGREAAQAEGPEIAALPPLDYLAMPSDTPPVPPTPPLQGIPPMPGLPPVPPIPAIPPMPAIPPFPAIAPYPAYPPYSADSSDWQQAIQRWEQAVQEWESSSDSWNQQVEAWARTLEQNSRAWDNWQQAFDRGDWKQFEEAMEQFGRDMEAWGREFEAEMQRLNSEDNDEARARNEEAWAAQQERAEAQREMALQQAEARREMAEHLREMQFEELERQRELQFEQLERQREMRERQEEMRREQLRRAEELRRDASRHHDQSRHSEAALRQALLEDGILKREQEPIRIVLTEKELKINGKNISGAQEARYRQLLRELGIRFGSDKYHFEATFD